MNDLPSKINVHFMPGDGQGWALDEDRRQMRQALRGVVQETSLGEAEVIHTPFWQGLGGVAPDLLKQAFVIAHADNPPFFYLKQPDFSWGQEVVDLWVARSQEALAQFQALNLPVEYIPYTIDPEIFFPLAHKKNLRKKLGLPQETYLIANFHRDTEGGDLVTPKLQKAPELMVAILKELKQQGKNFHVLLAGPRRHWIRQELTKEGIAYTFIGKQDVSGDDFGVNILERTTLNELTNAADLYLIPSRWEGGPQSVMEAAACRIKVLSTPLGVSRDILESLSLYASVEEAVNRIVDDIEHDSLQGTIEPQWQKWKQSHTTSSMIEGLQELYKKLPNNPFFQKKRQQQRKQSSLLFQLKQFKYRIHQRLQRPSLPQEVGWNHQPGNNKDLDEVMLSVGQLLKRLKITIRPVTGRGLEIIGWPTPSLPQLEEGAKWLQWMVPHMPLSLLQEKALLLAPSVQDIVYLRSEGVKTTAIALPLPLQGDGREEEPLVVEEGDRFASLQIWRAMAAGRPIIYPKKSAYYEQVFHGGVMYPSSHELPNYLEMAQKFSLEFQQLAKIPTMASAEQAFEKLLRCITSKK